MSKLPAPSLMSWTWKAFGLLPWLKAATSSQVTVMTPLVASMSQKTRLAPFELPPGLVPGLLPRVSTSAQNGAMIGPPPTVVIELGVKVELGPLKVRLPLLLMYSD